MDWFFDRNMRRELISKEELMAQLRLQGIEDVSEVKRAFMEGDGRVSIVPYDRPSAGGSNDDRRRGG